jgi:predicted lipoprotein with Yx(FWY)xxD motif
MAGAFALGAVTPAGASLAAKKATHTLTVGTAKVSSLGSVLTTSNGLTLYRFTADTSGHATCTGACAKVWPPLLVPKGDRLKGPRGLKGWSTINLGHGHKQAALNGAALYRFSGDTKKGQDKGQGVESAWFAVLANGSSSQPATPGAAVTTPTAGATTTQGHSTTPTTAKKSTPTVPPAPVTTVPTPTTQPAPVTTVPTPTTQPPPPATTTTAPPSGGYGY